MIINDVQGKYILKVDKSRRIVYETIIGMYTEEDYQRYDMEYRNKIVPYLGKGSWMKIIFMNDYKPSTMVTPEMVSNHVKWGMENGFVGSALIVNSATIKMQMNRSAKDSSFNNYDMKYFDNEKEADEWLKARGF